MIPFVLHMVNERVALHVRQFQCIHLKNILSDLTDKHLFHMVRRSNLNSKASVLKSNKKVDIKSFGQLNSKFCHTKYHEVNKGRPSQHLPFQSQQ